MNIGIRELRDGLSRHLAEVRNGHTLTVTEHGRPIARIMPIEEPSKLDQLIADGLVRPARTSSRDLPEPVHADGTVSDLVREQRP